MSKNKKLIFGILSICVLIIVVPAYWYFIMGAVPKEVKSLKMIENKMEVKLGEKIIAEYSTINKCTFKKSPPGGCPIGLAESDYYDVEIVQGNSGICGWESYTLLTAKKTGNITVDFVYACDNSLRKQYTISIVE